MDKSLFIHSKFLSTQSNAFLLLLELQMFLNISLIELKVHLNPELCDLVWFLQLGAEGVHVGEKLGARL